MTKSLKDNHRNGSTNNGASVGAAVHILRPFVEFLFFMWARVCVLCLQCKLCLFDEERARFDPKLWFLFINVWPKCVVHCTAHTHSLITCGQKATKHQPNTAENSTDKTELALEAFFVIVPCCIRTLFALLFSPRRLAMFGALYMFIFSCTFASYISI